jgi:hypothetical protein
MRETKTDVEGGVVMMKIRTGGLLLACLLALGACASGQAVAPSKPELVYIPVPPGDPLLDNGVSQGAVLGDRLWVIGSLGSLVSLGLTDESQAVAFDRDVVFLTKSGGTLWALRSTELRYREDPPARTPVGGMFVVSRSQEGRSKIRRRSSCPKCRSPWPYPPTDRQSCCLPLDCTYSGIGPAIGCPRN